MKQWNSFNPHFGNAFIRRRRSHNEPPDDPPTPGEVYSYALLTENPTTEVRICWLDASSNAKGYPQTLVINGDTHEVNAEVVLGADKPEYLYDITISNLEPDTEYPVIINEVNEQTVTTFPQSISGKEIKACVVSDIHINMIEHTMIDMSVVSTYEPDIMLIAGDILTGVMQTAAWWKTLIRDYFQPLNSHKLVPIFAVPGNHEYRVLIQGANPQDAEYLRFFLRNVKEIHPVGKNYGQITFSDYLQIIGLDTQAETPSEVASWLTTAINQNVSNVITIQHIPMLPGGFRSDPDTILQAEYRYELAGPLYSASNIRATFSGHNHVFKETVPWTLVDEQPSHENYFEVKDGKYLVETTIDKGIIECGDGFINDRPPYNHLWYLAISQNHSSSFRIVVFKEHEMDVIARRINGELINHTTIPL